MEKLILIIFCFIASCAVFTVYGLYCRYTDHKEQKELESYIRPLYDFLERGKKKNA